MKPLCHFCGVSIIGLRAHARFCSAKCRIYFRRRGIGIGPVEETIRIENRDERRMPSGARREAIFVRDKWTCYLCCEIIDRSAVYPAPFSPVLGHVLARASGGTDGEENLRAAHARCNAKKSHLPLDIFLAKA
jgi:hypothetical protein